MERGFEVHVYEYRPVVGGKARSIFHENLPGEHGFRFFPGFYRHVIDTMQRIPYPQGGTVADHLRIATRLAIARDGHPPVISTARFPRSRSDMIVALRALYDVIFNGAIGISHDDIVLFASKIWQILTSCQARRRDEYDKISWWHYVEAQERSMDYQEYFAIGLTRTLVAARATEVSTKTGGDIIVQLLRDMMRPGFYADRLLDGPTSDIWIQPWSDYLTGKTSKQQLIARGLTPVNIHTNRPLQAISCIDGKIDHVVVGDGEAVCADAQGEHGNAEQTYHEKVRGDYYIAALPVEVMAEHLTPIMLKADPTLKNIDTLQRYVRWMNGIQFFLKEDIPLVHGHVNYIDTPWALTSISQRQFWPHIDMRLYGTGELQGKIQGVLSVDISDWMELAPVPPEDWVWPERSDGKPVEFPPKEMWVDKTAACCTRSQVAAGVWEQLKARINVGNQILLKDEMVCRWFLCPAYIYPVHDAPPKHDEAERGEPLLVNEVGTWGLRPDAFTQIPNFFLASDYVRTFTDLATMEGANEAARRAVNRILEISQIRARPCKIWKLRESFLLAPLRMYDHFRYERGLGWKSNLPLWVRKLLATLVYDGLLWLYRVYLVKKKRSPWPSSRRG
jgi:uncharacterized protein with NAD-binding domain and iron-sulfur cluster